MMKALKITLSVLLMMVMMLTCAACGESAEEGASAAAAGSSAGTVTEEDGQNPIMNYVGDYACGRAAIHIEADGMDGVVAEVTWGSSAAETSVWTMSGTFNEEDLVFEYHDCVRKDLVFEESGEVKSEEEVYVGGHGFMHFSDKGGLSLTWQDDQEHVADDMEFEYAN